MMNSIKMESFVIDLIWMLIRKNNQLNLQFDLRIEETDCELWSELQIDSIERSKWQTG